MKDKELNEKESLELIARMIRNTRRNLDTGSGNSFLVWGYVGVLVTLAVWAGVTFTGNPVWMWGFWGIPVVGYLLMFLLLRKRQKPVKFYLDKILERVWGVFGMVCMMGVLAATDAGRYETILPLCAIFFSLGSIITGCIIRYTTFFIFPLFGFLWGLKNLLYTWGEVPFLSSLLWFVGVLVFSLIIPWAVLILRLRKKTKRRSGVKYVTRISALDKFLLSESLLMCIIVLQFILLPIATKGFRWENIGDLIIYTLSHALIQGMYPYAWTFQIVSLVMLMLLVLRARDDVALVYVLCGRLLCAVCHCTECGSNR